MRLILPRFQVFASRLGGNISKSMANARPDLPHLEDVTRLSDRVIRILGCNPGKFTLQGTNTYLIGKGPRRILIDTGEGNPKWFDLLKTTLKSENASLQTVLITHWHPDHVGGVKDVLTLSDPSFDPPKIHKHNPERNIPNDISPDQTFSIGDGESRTTLQAIHSPGHTSDHMSFLLKEEDALFTGDNVLGHGTAVFEDLATYLETLEMMARTVSGRGYPGHGEIFESTPRRIGEYVEHRRKREREVLDVLGRGQGRDVGSEKTEGQREEGWSSMEIVKSIYVDVPESLHLAAQRGIVQILDKLVEEGRVVHDGDRGTWRLVVVEGEKATL